MTDQADGSESPRSLSPNESGPRLPTELIISIAEFLIGDFAFGTTANLNLASHAIREETLAVLYETICVERMAMDVEAYVRNCPANPGFKCTNPVFRHASRALETLPNIALKIHVEPTPYHWNIPAEIATCNLHLYKPLSARTAFFILKTPLYGRTATDQDYVRLKQIRLSSQHAIGDDIAQSKSGVGTTKQAAKMCFYPVSHINNVNLALGAALQGRYPIELHPATHDLRLLQTEITGMWNRENIDRPGGQQVVATVLELLKLLGMQSQPLYQKSSHEADLLPYEEAWLVWCCGPPRPSLRFQLNASAVEDFLEKLDSAAEAVPKIMYNTFRINVARIEGDQDLEYLLSKAYDIYDRRLKMAPPLVLPETEEEDTSIEMFSLDRTDCNPKVRPPDVQGISNPKPKTFGSLHLVRNGKSYWIEHTFQ